MKIWLDNENHQDVNVYTNTNDTLVQNKNYKNINNYTCFLTKYI